MIITSHFPAETGDDQVGEKMSDSRKVMEVVGEGEGMRPRDMLWVRLEMERLVARGDMSTPVMCRGENDGERSEYRRRAMQPVPVQKSRMRRGWAGEVKLPVLSRCERCVV
jgi:hypothetical protein